MNGHHLPRATAGQPFPKGLYRSDFRPAWWLRNAHAQTIYATLFRKPVVLPRRRERLELPDGDWLSLDWLLPQAWVGDGRQPLVLAVHGLSGSSESHYITGLQQALCRLGWGSVAMNCRGAGGEPNELPRAYHAGASDDIRAVLDAIALRYPGRPLAVVGYSLGGNMTLKLLAELGDDSRVFAGVAVSVPLRLDICADRMDQGFSRVYRRHMIAALVSDWQEKARYQAEQGRPDAAARIHQHLGAGAFASFREFDGKLVAPLHGFADATDYYAKCSSRQFLRDIRIPTLVIQAEDDPFMSPAVLPGADELSGSVSFELADRGGHVGFIEADAIRGPRYYLERRVPQFLQEAKTALSKVLTNC